MKKINQSNARRGEPKVKRGRTTKGNSRYEGHQDQQVNHLFIVEFDLQVGSRASLKRLIETKRWPKTYQEVTLHPREPRVRVAYMAHGSCRSDLVIAFMRRLERFDLQVAIVPTTSKSSQGREPRPDLCYAVDQPGGCAPCERALEDAATGRRMRRRYRIPLHEVESRKHARRLGREMK